MQTAEIELKRGYKVLPDNNVRFGIRGINTSAAAILEVEVIQDFNASLFELEGSKVQDLSARRYCRSAFRYFYVAHFCRCGLNFCFVREV